jgi:hypothetical protein
MWTAARELRRSSFAGINRLANFDFLSATSNGLTFTVR